MTTVEDLRFPVIQLSPPVTTLKPTVASTSHSPTSLTVLASSTGTSHLNKPNPTSPSILRSTLIPDTNVASPETSVLPNPSQSSDVATNASVQSISRTIRAANAGGDNTCSFQNGFCIWQQSDQDDLQWSRQAGPTQTRRNGKILTGPLLDHTLESNQGFYAFLETSLTNTGEYADLISRDSYKQDTSLEFWYYFHGQSMGTLKVFAWPNGQPYPLAISTPLWTAREDMGDKWIKETLYIANTTPYKLIFRATVGGRGTSDIAIDDVSMKLVEPTTTTDPPSTAPVIVNKTDLYSCNFDYGTICGWSHPRFAIMTWLVRTVSTPTSKTGANKDHTSGTGRFAYIETTNGNGAVLNTGTMAVITSPSITVDRGCSAYMTFYYNMYGEDIGRLNIQLKNVSPSNVWSKTGQQQTDGDTWSKAEFKLPDSVQGKSFQVCACVCVCVCDFAARSNEPEGMETV
ncbi:MAM and LDL-receptor class a domain-containing protein 1 [Plakobranchus ocellatus]|uniref:MAM and LDL-receptor class a domain-containing protein 1 n=1 Tax=Plakobranchus ocellatus TaxID=259542 RepID=A0AAV4C7A8_9GAST|nr:MAM and LDL-receptor class a domain-containing protein 1 [Plakobranchus ocellatus]